MSSREGRTKGMAFRVPCYQHDLLKLVDRTPTVGINSANVAFLENSLVGNELPLLTFHGPVNPDQIIAALRSQRIYGERGPPPPLHQRHPLVALVVAVQSVERRDDISGSIQPMVALCNGLDQVFFLD